MREKVIRAEMNDDAAGTLGSPRDGIGVVINESGHVQESERNFSLLSAASVAIVTGGAWVTLGGSLALALYNGGPTGVLYEFIAVSIAYFFIAASLAELASAIPSSGGVYHWASIVGGSYGRPIGFFAGYLNFFAWMFAAASIASILGNQLVAMYLAFHPNVEQHAWQVFIAYELVTWLVVAIVLFQNRLLPLYNRLGLVLILGGFLVTIIVCVSMTDERASNRSVWATFDNQTGWSSNGLVFIMGMLNGAFAMGTPDCASHLAEEIPRPAHNLPRAIGAQMAVSFITGLSYLIAIFYSINNLPAALESSPAFPLLGVYRQATGSGGGAFALILVIFLPTFVTLIGSFITSGRTLWTLARDKATPFSSRLGQVSQRWHNPFTATLTCGVFSTLLGCIYVGSTTAFNAIIGSFVLLSTLSYLAAILPHLVSGRRMVVPGPFWMGRAGYVVNAVAVGYICTTVVIFCFPFVRPVTAQNMNYACVIVGGLIILIVLWWFTGGRRDYEGPPVRAALHPQQGISSVRAN